MRGEQGDHKEEGRGNYVMEGRGQPKNMSNSGRGHSCGEEIRKIGAKPIPLG